MGVFFTLKKSVTRETLTLHSLADCSRRWHFTSATFRKKTDGLLAPLPFCHKAKCGKERKPFFYLFGSVTLSLHTSSQIKKCRRRFFTPFRLRYVTPTFTDCSLIPLQCFTCNTFFIWLTSVSFFATYRLLVCILPTVC